MPRFYKKCRVHFHHRGHGNPDPDGVSGKACLDGLVRAGIFANDTAQEVYPPTHSYEKVSISTPETTTITIIEDGADG